MAVVPVAGPPKPPTVAVAVAEEGKEGQEAAQSPTDKDAEAKGESAYTERGGGAERKDMEAEGFKGCAV